jgi:hypothetical protein
MTQVFSGTVTFPAIGNWMTITFTTPFNYNNTDNLVIGIDENKTGWDCTASWRMTPTGGNSAIYYRSDATNPDPISPPTGNGVTANRPNVILGGIMQSCPTPSGLTTSNVSATSADLTWTENGTATTWDIEWGTTGFTATGSPNVTGTTTNPHNLTGLSANTSYEYYVRADCGVSGTSTWAGPYSFTTPCVALNAPFSETFDATSIPTCWSQSATTGGPWVFGSPGISWNNTGCPASTPADHTGNGGNFVALDFSTPDAGVILNLPIINVSGLTTPYLEFYHQMCATGYTPNETYVEAYNGTTWTQVTLINTGTASWEKYGFDISAFVYNTNLVQLRFRAEQGATTGNIFYGDVAIDDVSVIEAPSCLQPSNLTASNLVATSADLGWTENGTAVRWDIEWGIAGFTATGTPNITSTSTNPHNLSGLTANTTYDYYVRADCGGSGVSTWTGPYSFTTPCATFTAPYTQTFSTNALPSCWSQSSVSGDSWRFGTTVDFGTTTSTRIDASGNSGEYANIDFSDDPDTTALITPMVDVGSLTSPRLTFYYNSQTTNTSFSPYNRLIVDYWDGSNWVNITVIDVLTPAGWTKYAFDASSYTFNGSLVQFRFSAQEGGAAIGGTGSATYDQDLMLDEVVVEETPSCVAPSALTINNITFNSADLGWTENTPTPATSWQVEYGSDGFVPGMGVGTAVITGTNPYALMSLTENTVYDFYVRAICSPGDTSAWSQEGTFSTPLACPLPTALTATNVTATGADLGWTDNAGATAWDVEYGTVGFTQGAGTMVTGTATNPHSITGLSAGIGYDFYVRADCGGNGASPWVGPFSFATPFQAAIGVVCTTPGAISSVLFSEEFDNNNAGWTGDIGSGSADWEIPNNATSSNTGADNAHSGSSYMNFEASSAANQTGSIVSPAINLTGGFDAAELSFWIHAYGANMGTLNVGVSTSASGPFTTVMTSIGQLQTAGSDVWQNVGADLSAYIGQTIYIQFSQSHFVSYEGDMSIDLVEVTTCEKCKAPSNLMTSNVSTTGAELVWTENGTATTWDIEWGATGFTQGSGIWLQEQ